jgi:hypothetical protein
VIGRKDATLSKILRRNLVSRDLQFIYVRSNGRSRVLPLVADDPKPVAAQAEAPAEHEPAAAQEQPGAGPTRIAASDGAAEPFAPKKIVIEFHKDRYACNLDLALTIAPPWWVQWWVGREMAASYQRIACNFPRQMPSGDDGLPRHKR